MRFIPNRADVAGHSHKGCTMSNRHRGTVYIASWIAALLAGLNAARVGAQQPLDGVSSATPPGVYSLTLEEAKQRALANSKLRSLAYMNIKAKQEGIYVMEADYYPKLFAGFTGFHFDAPLGRVLTPGLLPLAPIAVNVVNQDLGVTTMTAVQPITALLKVRQGTIVAEADEQIARSQAEQADRAIASGVEQLYFGLLAANRILAGAQTAAAAAQHMGPALASSTAARIAGVEAKQAIQAVSSQAAELEEQLNGLVELPLCTRLNLFEPPPVAPCLNCAEQAIALALGSSPEVFQADQDAVKAEAGVRVAKVDWLPDVLLMGGYVNQNGINVIQNDITYGAVSVNYPLFEGGKRIHALRQAEMVQAMARQKACQVREEVSLKAQKAYREYAEAQVSLQTAEEMLQVRKEAQRKADTADEMIKAAGEVMKAEAAVVQAEVTCRVAGIKLATIAGL
jgi:outer membrane protein TolC